MLGDRRSQGGGTGCRAVQVVGHEHLAALPIEQLEAEDLAHLAQPAQLVQRFAACPTAIEHRLQTGHGGGHDLGITPRGGFGVTAQVLLAELPRHRAQQRQRRHQAQHPQQHDMAFAAPE